MFFMLKTWLQKMTSIEDQEQTQRVLTLDGGGVRGLSSLYILQSLMKCVNEIRDDKGLEAVKPHQLFDLIAGTSTGGLIAIMLGRLRMSVDECISAYQQLCQEVFQNPRHIASRGKELLWNQTVPAKFSSQDLEKQIVKVLKEHLPGRNVEQELLLDDNRDSVKARVFVCATSKATTNNTTRLRSYPAKDIGQVANPTILQAALATSAATGFFDPVEIDDELFVDGALSANNPVFEAFEELKKLRGVGNDTIESQICSIVSIGTGKVGLNPISDNALETVRESLVNIATETERTAQRFHEAHRSLFQSGRAFRFDVPYGLQGIGLDEWKFRGEIRVKTRAYLSQTAQDYEFRLCAKQLAVHASRWDKMYLKARKKFYQFIQFWWLMLAVLIMISAALFRQASLYEGYLREKSPVYNQLGAVDSRLPIYALLGVTGVGKSSFIATVGGRHVKTGEPPSVGHQLQSHTQNTDFYLFDSLVTGQGYLIDTPGIDESNRTRTDLEIMHTIRNSLREVKIKDKMLMGLIFLYDIHQPRAYGSILTALDGALDLTEYLLGTNGVAKITLVTTKWTEEASERQRIEEERREQMLREEYWWGPITCNSEMARYDNTKESALNIIASLRHRERPIYRPANGCRKSKPELKQDTTPVEVGRQSNDGTASQSRKVPGGEPALLRQMLRSVLNYFYKWTWPLMVCLFVISALHLSFSNPNAHNDELFVLWAMVTILYVICSIVYEFVYSTYYDGFIQLIASLYYWVVPLIVFIVLTRTFPFQPGTPLVFLFIIFVCWATFAIHAVGYVLGYGSLDSPCHFLHEVIPDY